MFKKDFYINENTDEGLFECNEDDDFYMDHFDDPDFGQNDEYSHLERRSDSFFANNNNHPSDYNINQFNKRVLSPSKVELLSKLLENEEKQQQDADINGDKEEDELATDASKSSFLGFIRNISSKYFGSNVSPSTNKMVKKRKDCDDPDTPPSSPINLPSNLSQNILFDVLNSAKTYFGANSESRKSQKTAPTPPGTPTHELERSFEANSERIESNTQTAATSSTSLFGMQSFFDQIVNKLSSFSFKTVPSNSDLQSLSSATQPHLVHKPSPIYPPPKEAISEFDEEEKELVELELGLKKNADETKMCSTPPPSPSKFSPPLPELEHHDYSEEQIKKSAFVKVASLNPYLNQSVDLASLLGTLSSLKRSQRF